MIFPDLAVAAVTSGLRALTLLLAVGSVSCRGSGRSPGSEAAQDSRAETEDTALRERFLQMYARAYFPGRTGQLLIVPREGDIVTRPGADAVYMHGSPWPYDVSIPLLFAGPAVEAGVYEMPAAQQDVAPTLAAALGVRMPPSATGRVLPILKSGFARPRVVLLLVLDGMRRDYFDRHRELLPTLDALRRRGAWFPRAAVDFVPTNTAVGHATLATGADPRVHGISSASLYDRGRGRRYDLLVGPEPRDLMALTLSDVWLLATLGRAIVLAQGSADRAATPLAGHGACQPNGAPVVLASYDAESGGWRTNPACYRLPAYLAAPNAKALLPADGLWMGHPVDSTSLVRYSALFPGFEADATVALIEHEPLGEDDVADLVLVNLKAVDWVGHAFGPDSEELRVTLAEMDRQIARILDALEAKVGAEFLLALSADHGMPSEPPSPDRRHFVPAIVDLLHERFDPGARALVTSFEPENGQIFVDEARLAELGSSLRDLARFLETQPFLFAVFTEEEVRRAAEAHARPGRASAPGLHGAR